MKTKGRFADYANKAERLRELVDQFRHDLCATISDVDLTFDALPLELKEVVNSPHTIVSEALKRTALNYTGKKWRDR